MAQFQKIIRFFNGSGRQNSMKLNLIIILLALSFIVIGCNNKESEQQPQTQTKTAEVTELNKTETNSNTENNTIASSAKGEKNINLNNATDSKNKTSSKSSEQVSTNDAPKYPIVTFIELGSVNCIPCKKMQPIMKSLEKKYDEQLKVIFYDVWKDEYKDKSIEYGIRLIPTQIFLDANKKEIHRHEGYYPEEDIDKFLQSKGLKINS